LVLDAAKRIGPRLNRYRVTLPGRPYVDPPAQPDRLDPRTVEPEEYAALWRRIPQDDEAAAARLMSHFEGLSPFLATEVVLRTRAASPEAAWAELFGAARREEWRPVLVRDERGETIGAYPFETLQVPAERQHARDTILSALEAHYLTAIPRAEREAALHEVGAHLRRALAAREKRIVDLRHAVAEADRAAELRRQADLLMAHAHEAAPAVSSITLPNDYDPGSADVVIRLDPALSARENAEAMYRRCRKLADGAVHSASELSRAESEAAELRAALLRLDGLRDAAAIRALRRELTVDGLLHPESPGSGERTSRRGEPEFDGHRIRRVRTPEGYEILVGESATANDYLTRRIAEPDDLWFHVRQNTGAHVVVRTRRKPEAVPFSVIQEAARLAAAHSAAKHSSVVPVDYTLKKHVRRPRNAAPGQALYQHEKTLHVQA
jgi:predicted ribosome quality control (RQC) complex YloA/Tae2 family protein